MPKFLYTVIILNVLSWGFFIYLTNFVKPINYLNIFAFLGSLFLALGFSLSILFFYYLKRIHKDFSDSRILYRMSFKRGMFISLGIMGLAFLKAFHLLNLLNTGLFLLLYIGFFYQMKSKR